MRNTTVYLFGKRIFDIVASLLAILVFLIPWAVIGIIIKIQSPGPVIYKARRIGQDGRVFTLYKFRSMRVDSGVIHATTLKGDPRIFAFGQFLRDSKLDETPQLINILKGEMSVIGPRPEDEENSDKFYVGRYREILSAKPGLSSPASLYDYTHGENYPSEEIYIQDFLPKKLDVELYYVEHRSWAYDVKIIVRTVLTILQIMIGKKDFEEPGEVQYAEKSFANGSFK
jgi:putative colanic acid biosynthesis UDP-glucose lipid carrier transferase